MTQSKCDIWIYVTFSLTVLAYINDQRLNYKFFKNIRIKLKK